MLAPETWCFAWKFLIGRFGKSGTKNSCGASSASFPAGWRMASACFICIKWLGNILKQLHSVFGVFHYGESTCLLGLFSLAKHCIFMSSKMAFFLGRVHAFSAAF